jgi:hypothetical protein
MRHRSTKHNESADEHGPIRPGSPLHMAISMIAANIARKLDADDGLHDGRHHSCSVIRSKGDATSGSDDVA